MNRKEIASTFQTQFAGQVKVLIIDDDLQIHELLKNDIFTSKLFSFTSALTLDSARSLTTQKGWHAWILDLSLDNRADGTILLSRIPPFPYVIGLSGLRSMEKASKAVASGAMAVFDKDPTSFYASDQFYNEFCRVSSLGFVAGGRPCDSIQLFKPLFGELVTTPEEWADRAFISVRHLHRLCDLYCGVSPKHAITLFNAVYFALRGEELPACLEEVDSDESRRLLKDKDAYLEAMSFAMKKLAE